MKYVAIKPRAYDVEWHAMPATVQATTVYEADEKPEETGLLDMHGTPLYRIKNKRKMGFL
jgi:hypothetical protein